MRQSRYLNVILTVNAVLLSGLLWTQVAERPMLAAEATAQSRNTATPPNSAELRKRQLDETKALRRSVDELTKLVKSGNIKVKVTNLSDISIPASDG